MRQRRNALLVREFFERLIAEKDFRRRAWRWLRPAPQVYSSVRIFLNGVELQEASDIKTRWKR